MMKNEKSTQKISLVDFCINFQHTYNILLSYKKDDTQNNQKQHMLVMSFCILYY